MEEKSFALGLHFIALGLHPVALGVHRAVLKVPYSLCLQSWHISIYLYNRYSSTTGCNTALVLKEK